jgi:hypothetical protein
MLAGGCKTAAPESATKFREGLAVVQNDSQKIFVEFNALVREVQLDRAEKLTNLRESDVAPALDAESVGRWNMALEAMSLYASALMTLADPARAKEVETSLKALGDHIVALCPPKEAASSQGGELTQAVSHIGGLVTDVAARRKALELACEADPSIRVVLLQMAGMIGCDQTTGGVRTTMWTNCTLRADQLRGDFLAARANKRKVAATYATAIESRQASDAALCALRRALLDLADVHTAMAQGRSADAAEVIQFMRQEVAYAKELLDSTRVPNSWAIRRWDQPNLWSANIACTTAILSWCAMPNLPKPKLDRFREILTANRRLLKVAGFEPDPTGWVYPILDIVDTTGDHVLDRTHTGRYLLSS